MTQTAISRTMPSLKSTLEQMFEAQFGEKWEIWATIDDSVSDKLHVVVETDTHEQASRVFKKCLELKGPDCTYTEPVNDSTHFVFDYLS